MVEQEPRAVYRGHGKAPLRERHRMASRATTEIKHLPTTDAGEPQDLFHLFLACPSPKLTRQPSG